MKGLNLRNKNAIEIQKRREPLFNFMQLDLEYNIKSVQNSSREQKKLNVEPEIQSSEE